MRKIHEEVDEVLGDEPIRLDHIAKLKYTSGTYIILNKVAPLENADTKTQLACLRESLRLNPPATMRVVESVEDTTVCNGKYAFKKGDRIGLLACRTQTDPKIWGPDVSIRVHADTSKHNPDDLLA